jgi:hypothetical protein
MSKLKFNELHAEDVTSLMFKMVEIIAGEGCRGIHHLAETRGKTPLELWPEFCAEAGLDECEPWDGYPDNVPSLEYIMKTPGSHRPLRSDHKMMKDAYWKATGRDKS